LIVVYYNKTYNKTYNKNIRILTCGDVSKTFFLTLKVSVTKTRKVQNKKARIPDSNKVGIIMVILAILRRYSFYAV